MYGFEYEFDVLLVLRLMKILHERDPEALKRATESHPVLTLDELELLIEPIIWSLFEDLEYDVDEFEETEIMRLTHPVIDSVYISGTQQQDPLGNLQSVWQKKIQDITEFFINGPTGSVYRLRYDFSSSEVRFEMWLSPDYHEPLVFLNTLADMLLYFERELQRLQENQTRKEAV